MRLIYGNMWASYTDYHLVLVTTNSYIKSNGRLVMGTGAAREALKRLPGIDKQIGSLILRRSGHLGKYGLIVPTGDMPEIGAFQVKYSPFKKAVLELIGLSAEMLYGVVDRYSVLGYDIKVALNFLGIGFGQLTRAEVMPIIEELQDNVEVWQYESQDGNP